MKTRISIMAVMLAAGATAQGALTLSVSSSAPTYTTTLNFDEVGGPVGTVPADAWSSIGLASITNGDGSTVVGNNDQGWGVNDGNSFYGIWGVFMNFSTDLNGFSAQIWDPSGPSTPFGGGAAVFAYDNGVEVFAEAFSPAWGGLGDEWVNLVADGGSQFDEIRILGFGFFPTTMMDNVSWSEVPAPGAATVVACLGLGALRRRR